MDLIKNAKTYGGVWSLMLTPFNEDRSIDFDTYEKYCDWQVSQRPYHLFSVCGSSEMAQLKLDERLKLASLAVKHKGDVTVFATANLEPSWHAQTEEVKKMEQTGVDGLVFVTKGYGDDDERMVAYMSELAEFTTLPVVLYEFPGYHPSYISGKAYGELVKTGRFHGVKDTTCTMEGIKSKIDVQGDSSVLQANIPFLYDALEAGARGVVATPSTCGTNILRRLFDAYAAGDKATAKIMHQEICSLSNALDGGFTATAKYLVTLQE